jgi:hypothetical protein
MIIEEGTGKDMEESDCGQIWFATQECAYMYQGNPQKPSVKTGGLRAQTWKRASTAGNTGDVKPL